MFAFLEKVISFLILLVLFKTPSVFSSLSDSVKSIHHAAVLPVFLLSFSVRYPCFLLYFSLPPPILSCSIVSLKPIHLPIGPLADLSSGLYDDSDSEVEEVEPANTRDQKGVGGSVTSPQGNLPRLPFFKKVTLVITPGCINRQPPSDVTNNQTRS